MFVLNKNTEYPLKIWLESPEAIEESCLEQAYNLVNLPFVHKWVCLMPQIPIQVWKCQLVELLPPKE